MEQIKVIYRSDFYANLPVHLSLYLSMDAANMYVVHGGCKRRTFVLKAFASKMHHHKFNDRFIHNFKFPTHSISFHKMEARIKKEKGFCA